MKKILFLSLAIISSSLSAQINASSAVNNTIAGENPFLDVSSNSAVMGWSESESKGLAFPQTDLSKFVFKTDAISPGAFPTAFDGMIVYNIADGTNGTGTATADPSLTTQTTGLQRGFYYFHNPDGVNSLAVTSGRWLPLGASPKVTVLTSETATNTLINDGTTTKQVYAVKGTFTATGSSTTVSIPSPSGMTSMYGITIYKTNGTGNKVVYSRDLYSYNLGSTGNAVTGSPSISVVYPADTYDYVLEYVK